MGRHFIFIPRVTLFILWEKNSGLNFDTLYEICLLIYLDSGEKASKVYCAYFRFNACYIKCQYIISLLIQANILLLKEKYKWHNIIAPKQKQDDTSLFNKR